MRCFDVAGYVVADQVLCADCAQPAAGDGAIFPDAEWDVPVHCEECGELIPTQLTPDGLDYVLDRIADYFKFGNGVSEVLLEWWLEWEDQLLERLRERLTASSGLG